RQLFRRHLIPSVSASSYPLHLSGFQIPILSSVVHLQQVFCIPPYPFVHRRTRVLHFPDREKGYAFFPGETDSIPVQCSDRAPSRHSISYSSSLQSSLKYECISFSPAQLHVLYFHIPSICLN